MTGQILLWGYDFQYMPIALISAVYDRFLKEEAGKKHAEGAFYTPMFLADVVVDQIWAELSEEQRASGVFYDPACGSGIFLVRLFQRLVANHCRLENKTHATWTELVALAHRVHGGDINASAVRVAVCSLYIALLENSDPPDLLTLIKKGKLLPPLYGDTIRAEDFFATPDGGRYVAVVGNPPWKGRAGQITTAQTWAKAENCQIRQGHRVGIYWKSLRILAPGGFVGLLLPAMAFWTMSRRKHKTRGASSYAALGSNVLSIYPIFAFSSSTTHSGRRLLRSIRQPAAMRPNHIVSNTGRPRLISIYASSAFSRSHVQTESVCDRIWSRWTRLYLNAGCGRDLQTKNFFSISTPFRR